MNERQRKFLVEQVTKTYEKQKKVLESKIPEEPSISNHVIAALLDNKLVVHSSDVIKEKLRNRALRMHKESEPIVKEEDRYSYRTKQDSITRFVKMKPEDLFEMPTTYQEEMDKYNKIKSEVDKELAALHQQHSTIVLKVEIGSGKQLEALVMQVDSMGSLDLINNTLILGATEEPKRIS